MSEFIVSGKYLEALKDKFHSALIEDIVIGGVTKNTLLTLDALLNTYEQIVEGNIKVESKNITTLYEYGGKTSNHLHTEVRKISKLKIAKRLFKLLIA